MFKTVTTTADIKLTIVLPAGAEAPVNTMPNGLEVAGTMFREACDYSFDPAEPAEHADGLRMLLALSELSGGRVTVEVGDVQTSGDE